jgi:hypothetical protein
MQGFGLSTEQTRSGANFTPDKHGGYRPIVHSAHIIKRQAMRANCLARAAAINFGGFRSSSGASIVWAYRICLSKAVAPTINVRSTESPAFVSAVILSAAS